jgi:tripartite ATP-independent transporter DctM subunit
MDEVVVFGGLIALITFTRLPLGFVMMFMGAAGIAMLHPRGWTAAIAVAEQQIVDLAMNYQFSVLPLFILMGVFVVKAGLADDIFDAARAWLGHFRGGLGMAAIVACGAFSAISTSSTAGAATMGRVSIPAMERARYNRGFAAGTVAAGGTLLIPPSGALIVYGLLTEISIGDLYLAAMIPGAIQLAIYLAVMLIVAWALPAWVPADARATWRLRFQTLARIWSVIALFLVVVGGLVSGLFTTVETAAIGAGGAFLVAVGRRRMTLRVFVQSVVEATRVASMIFLVAAGALVLNQYVNLSGLSGATVDWIEHFGWPPLAVLFCFVVFYFLLGTFMDGFAMIFLTVPVIVPVVDAMGYDLVWWGVLTVIVVESSLISPPVGLNMFVIKAIMPKLPLTAIFRGVMPYVAADVVRTLALLAFPALALWLPGIAGP